MMLNIIYLILISYVIGGSLGSFANMLIYRLSYNVSFKKSRSFCPTCQHNLSVKDLIPVISFILQKGLCNYCLSKISFRYILVELIMIITTLVFIVPNSPVYLFLQLFIFLYCSLILFYTDIETYLLPLSINGVLIALGFIFSLLNDQLLSHVYETTLIVLVLLIFRFIFNTIYKRDTFGLGDIIYIGVITLNWGWLIAVCSFYGAIISGGLFSIALILTKKRSIKDLIPFGPFLILNFLVVYIFSLYYPIQELFYFFL